MLDLVDFFEEVEDALELYEKSLIEYVNFSRLARTGDEKEIQKYIKRLKQDNKKSENGFALAMDWINIISPRYYIDGVDITEAMREFLVTEDMSAYTDWNDIYEELREYEIEHIKAYSMACRGLGEEGSIYDQYIKCVKELNSFYGMRNASRKENVAAFRELVEKTIEAKKKCQIVINFTSSMIPMEVRKTYTEQSLTYEDAYETCQEIISNVRMIFHGTTDASLSEMFVGAKDLLEDKSNRSPQPNNGVNRIMKYSVLKYLEACGVTTKLYTKYTNVMKFPKYLPNKKLVLALAAYCQPYCKISGKADKECHIGEHVECFMNQHGLTLNSFFETVSEYDEMTDEDAKMLLEDGLPVDSFAFMLKTFARTEKDFSKE